MKYLLSLVILAFCLTADAATTVLPPGRTFYVATNGNNSTAQLNNPLAPYAPKFDNVSGVCTLATNAGDTIFILPGVYSVANGVVITNIPIRMGVTFQGLGMPLFSSTNLDGVAAGYNFNYSFFQPKDNVTIRGVAWQSTNGWTPILPNGHNESVVFSGLAFTNLLIEGCDFFGGSDMFASTNSAGAFTALLRGNKFSSYWDLFALTVLNTVHVTSVGNTWNGLGDPLRPSNMIVQSPCTFEPYGDRFVGFQGPNNDVVYVTAASGSDAANINGKYVLSATSGIFNDNGLCYWTNMANSTYVFSINDPVINAAGVAPSVGITSNGVARLWDSAGQAATWANPPTNHLTTGDGALLTCDYRLGTNTLIASALNATFSPVLVPIPIGSTPPIYLATNQQLAGSFLIASSYQKARWTQDGSTLTNIASTNITGPVTATITNFSAYAAGTAYTYTGTHAVLHLGTTDPTVTLNQAGTYLITGSVGVKYVGATYAGAQSVTNAFRRTNNTAADLANGKRVTELPVLTTFTGGDVLALPPIIYTAASGDIISIFGALTALPAAGSVVADSAEIVAIRIR